MREIIATIAVILGLLNVVPYVVSILRGRTRPARSSYLIWTVVNIVGLASYVAVGATQTAWLWGAFTVTGLIVLSLSLRYGIGGVSRVDLFCLAIAIIAVASWAITRNAEIAVYLSVAAVATGYVPTYVKLWKNPGTESGFSWGLTLAASALNLAIVNTLAPKILVPPLVSFLLVVALTTMIVYQRREIRMTEIGKR